MKAYHEITRIQYEGRDSQNPFAFKYYNPDEMIEGKRMRDHLKFAMSYWHTIDAEGADMFGNPTMDKKFGKDAMEMYKAKADFAFDLMDKLDLDYYCFHDADIAPEGETLAESLKNYHEMVDYLLLLQKKHGKKLLWATSNLFSHKRFMLGAATSGSADVFAIAAAKVRACIDACIKLGGTAYVFWGGREGYETLLNTDMGLELDNLARFLTMARDYGRKQGFQGDFYLEPKPKEPTKHQYDFDAGNCIAFLRKYDLMDDFKLNIEANHATLAGHTFEHELRLAAVNGVFGSVDANQGDMLLGWDTDQFPTDIYTCTYAMLEILRAGGFTNGGLNFDAKTRRPSNTLEDILLAYIAGMDSFALALRKAVEIRKDGRLDAFVKNKYRSYESGIGKKIVENTATLEELADYAVSIPEPQPESGRQEYLETIVNNILFR